MNELKIPSIIVHKGKKEEKYRIYVEDYVVSYLKYQAQRMETGTVFFYGKKEGQIYLIYGAGRKEHIPEFEKYQLLQEVSWNLTQAGAFFFIQEDQERYRIQGYDIFYQTNEEMQNYMIDERRGKSDAGRGQANAMVVKSDEPPEWDGADELAGVKPETVQIKDSKRTDDLEKCMKAAQVPANGRGKEHMPRLISLQLCAIFLLLTAIVIVSMDSYGKMDNLIQTAKEVFFAMENEEKQREYQTATGEEAGIEEAAGNSEGTVQSGGTETAQPDGTETVQSDKTEAAENSEGNGKEMETADAAGNSKETGIETVQSDRTEVSDMNENSEKTGKEIGTTQTDQTDSATDKGEGTAAATEPDLKLVTEENTDTEQALSRNVTRYYEVEKGDTLYTISREIYGDISKVQQICELNQIEDPDNISYGQKIILP